MQVFYTSPWVPPEWIKAHGLEPRGIWFSEDFTLESLPLAAGVCSFANAVVRFAEKQTASALVFTTHCDQLRRGFDSVAGSASSRVFLFNLPVTWQTPVAQRIFASELERLGHFLVTLGGRSPSSEAFLQILAESNRVRARLLGAAASCPARQYAEAIARFHWDGSISQPPAAEHTCPQPRQVRPSAASQRSSDPTLYPAGAAEGRRAPDLNAIPVALVGGPLPRSQWHVLDVIESAGGRVVLNATEAGERSLWSAANAQVSDRPGGQGGRETTSGLSAASAGSEPALQAITHAYLDRYVDVFQRPNSRLYDWLKQRLSSRRVRGIILWQYVGCDLWRAEAQSLRDAFGLPVLLLEADEAVSDSLRQSGRIQAFLESLK
jgi:benzoyl-CoA reductase/2-hydroxyglutaryl-CoA dehydratase subunit BcrC/BadD/HgdB